MASNLLQLIHAQLVAFSGLDNFWDAFDTAFGKDYDRTVALRLRSQWQVGDFSQSPDVEVVSSTVLGSANGAYASSTNTIYLSDVFVNGATGNGITSATLLNTLLEEYGHFVDAQVNATDTLGDEGELFSDLVRGVEISSGELQRLRTEDDHATVTIDGQPLQVEQSNYNLGLVQGTLSWNDSVTYLDYGDNWTFQISVTGGTANYVSVASNNSTSVDLILELYDQYGTLRRSSNLYNNTYNYESLSLSGLSAGIYRATVYDYFSGQYLNPYSASYTLTINAPSISQDIYEGNNSRATAINLGALSGKTTLTNLTIHSSADTDFFKFTTNGLSGADNYVGAYFDWTQGVIDLNLLDGAGNLLYYTLGSYGWNYIPLGGLPAGTYYVQAGSYQLQTSPSYALEFNTPIALTNDRFESNNTFSTAKDLGTLTNEAFTGGFKRWENLWLNRSSYA